MRVVTPRAAAKSGHDVGQAGAQPQSFGAQDMGGEILVAELEPEIATVAADRVERVPGVAGDAPAGGRIGDPGQRVEDRVEVGADPQPEELEIVGGVDDHGQVAGRQFPGQALGELGAADAARQRHDHLECSLCRVAGCGVTTGQNPWASTRSIASRSVTRCWEPKTLRIISCAFSRPW